MLAVDRGFALLAAPDGGARLVTLSGDDLGTRAPGQPVLAGLVEADRTVLVTGDEVVVTTVPDGVVVDRVGAPGALPLAAVHGRVLLVEAAEPTTLREFAVDPGGGLTSRDLVATDPVVAAAPTPAGTVLLTSGGLGTDRADAVPLPPAVAARGLVASEDGQVGLLVDGPSTPVLLVWGRDLPG